MNQQTQPHPYANFVSDEHRKDVQEKEMQCNHNWTTWPQNVMTNICTKCGSWHWKQM